MEEMGEKNMLSTSKYLHGYWQNIFPLLSLIFSLLLAPLWPHLLLEGEYFCLQLRPDKTCSTIVAHCLEHTHTHTTAQQNSIRGKVCKSLWICSEYRPSAHCIWHSAHCSLYCLFVKIWCEQQGRLRGMLQDTQHNMSFITHRYPCHLWVWETYASRCRCNIYHNIQFNTL